MTLSSNISVTGFFLREKAKSSLLLMKGIDLVDEKSGANYSFLEYAFTKDYRRLKIRCNALTSIAQPKAFFDARFSMSGLGMSISTKGYRRFELTTHYIVPWENSSPNVIVRGRMVFEDNKRGVLGINTWYNSGMFGKNTGFILGIEYLSKKLELSKDIKLSIHCIYNCDVAGNLLHIENPSSKNLATMRIFLWF